MMKTLVRLAVLATASLGVAACGAQQQQQQQLTYDASLLAWARIDGRRVTGNPQLESGFAYAQTMCSNRALAAPIETNPIYYNPTPGNSAAYAMRSCMAEQGYVLLPRSALPPEPPATAG